MIKFRLRFFVISFLIFISVSNISFPQSCQDCGRRSIGVFDPFVLVPRPSGDNVGLVPKWWQLFRVGNYIRAYMHNQDPSNSCMTFIDMNILRAEPGTSSWKDSLVFGQEWANTPPAGPVNSIDYLVESTVSGTEGNYVLTSSLQAAVSREVVTSATMQFADMWDAPDIAQQLAAQNFSPIYNKIRSWEEKKRDEDPNVSIGAEKITITPEKKRIEVNEEVNVNFEFKDCDGKPLKNKSLQLIEGEAYGIKLTGPTGGHFSTPSVTTDDEGKASAIFVADNKPGEGVLRAYFVYKYPSGHNGIAGGEAMIQIAQPPVEYWEFNATVTNTLNYSADTSWAGSLGGIPYNGFDMTSIIRNGSLSARGLFKNEAYEPGLFYYSGDGEPIIAGFASGSCSETEMSNKAEYIMGTLVSGDKRTDITGGQVIPDYVGFQFYYDENTGERIAGVGASCRRIGEYKGKWYDGPDWVDYDGKYDDSLANVSAGWDPDKGTGSFSKTDTGFVVNCSVTESSIKHEYGKGTLTTTETKSLSLTIRPFSYLTSVKRKNNLLPDKFELSQNYPNPFNPVTTIQYQIAENPLSRGAWGVSVTLKVYDILGNEITTLVNEKQPAGNYKVQFDAGKYNLSNGVYFYRLKAGEFTSTKKLILLK